jgi:drug/metabolite transporter (DMT)-like permease
VFFLRGPASELSKFGKKAFVLLTLIIILNMFVDGVGVKGLNWYMYSIISSGFSLLIAFIILLFEKKYVYLKELNSPILIAIGLVFAFGEFVILYSMQNYLPVSIAFLFLRLSAPIVMFVSAYIYKERTPKEQLLFGGLAVLFALPILFK